MNTDDNNKKLSFEDALLRASSAEPSKEQRIAVGAYFENEKEAYKKYPQYKQIFDSLKESAQE